MYAWVSAEATNFVFVFREKATIYTSAAGGAQFRSFCFTANLFHLPMGKYIEIFFASIASLVPSNEIDISLFECLGVYSSAPRTTKNLLSRSRFGRSGDRCCSEKLIFTKFCWTCKDDAYQRLCYFLCFEHLKALIMEYMGPTIKDVSDLR